MSGCVCYCLLYLCIDGNSKKVAVLSDLYTLPENRGKGIGKQLIEYCRNFAYQNGAVRLQWVTAADNLKAQALYDSLNTSKSAWCFYTYKTTL